MDNKERMSNIELLRLLSALGGVILHYNNVNSGGAFLYVQKDSINEMWLFFTESLFICAVNVFIIISGYFLVNNSIVSIKKALLLLVLIVFTQIIMYIAECTKGITSFSVKQMLTDVLPANYFAILYL